MFQDSPVDPRGPRFSAWATSVVLAVVLVTGWWWLLAVQSLIFAVSAFVSLRYNPWGQLYRSFVAPRLKPSSEREETPPLRFAQGVGFAFALIGTISYATGVPVVGIAATAVALAAAFLNAAFGLCLGCETYLLLRRFGLVARPRRGEPIATSE